MARIRLARAYDPPEPEEGKRILVDRLWPRGLSRERARIAAWAKDVAPSDALRRWYGHDPERWSEFRRRYFEELDRRPDAVAALRREIGRGPATLVFAARDPDRSNAAALRDYLERRSGERRSRAATRGRRSRG